MGTVKIFLQFTLFAGNLFWAHSQWLKFIIISCAFYVVESRYISTGSDTETIALEYRIEQLHEAIKIELV